MSEFIDRMGRRYQFGIDIVSLRRVRNLLGIDLVALPVDELLDKLASPLMLVDILYCLCKPDADRQDVDDETFGSAAVMNLDAAALDIARGIADFHQQLGHTRPAKLLTAAAAKAEELQTTLTNESEAVDRAVTAAMDKAWGDLTTSVDSLIASGRRSTTSQESSA